MPGDEDLSRADATPQTAGAMLAAAREAAGLTVDAVAAQLKLAPRQVRALEEGDFAALPGRTFVRGFARNYARLLEVDAERVLAALPDAAADPGLSHPHLASTQRAIGEIPADRPAGKSFAGWAIALALLAIVVLAIFYERVRTPALGGASAPASMPAEPAPAAPGPDGKSLPNPVVPPAQSPSSSNDEGSRASSPPPADVAASAPPPAVMPTSTAAAPAAEPAASAPAASQVANVTPTSSTAAPATPAAGESMLAIAFRGTSWIDIKDAHGTSVLTMTGGPGTARTLDAKPPLDLIVGNASDVDITFRGEHVDLTSHMRQNVARLTLR
jgi:cytoskeleton protein RodZ